MDIHSYDNVEEAFPIVKDLFENKWHTSFEYNYKDMIRFTGSDLPEDISSNSLFGAYVYYIMTLYDIVAYRSPRDILPMDIVAEAIEWDSNGGQCIYLASLLYALFLEDKIVKEDQMVFCQGMYMHMCREDFPMGFLLGGEHSGLHAWIEVKGAVVDISIRQEEDFFDFKDEPYIMGKVPDGLTMMGYKETKDVAKRYCRDAAKKANTYYLEWLNKHRIAAHENFLKYLENELRSAKG
ncbi:hypothetical protein D3C71_1453110 [compost metagenome]